MTTMRQTIARAVRVMLLSPVIACLALIPMAFVPDVISDPMQIVVATICLALLPLLSYPLWYVIPSLRSKGRDGQRTLAMIFSVVGYVLLFVLSLCLRYPVKLQVFALTYLLSGAALLICRLFGLRPSGHCCGVCGPIVYLTTFVSPWYAFAIVLVAAVIWSSLALQRHTLLQCLTGSVISPLALVVSSLILL